MPEKERKQVGVGLGVLVTKGNQLLLVKRSRVHGAGCWCTPGGFLDFGEEFEEGARREVMEEVGVEVGEFKILGLTNDRFEDQKRHSITIWLEAPYKSGEPHPKAQEELDEVAWFDRDSLPQPLYFSLRQYMEGKIYPLGTTGR